MSFVDQLHRATRTGASLRRGVFGAVLGALLVPALSSAGEVRFSGEGHAYNPAWSADGKHIAFEVNRYAGDINLFVAEVNGDIAKDGVQVALPGGSNPFGGGGQVVVNPNWHPAGVVVFEGSNQGGQYRLYYYQPGGGAAAEMISSQEISGDLTFPTITSDGALMGFIADATGDGDIRTRDTNTAKLSHVTQTAGSEMFPLFSKDNSKILFTRKKNNTEDVFQVPVSGGDPASVSGGGGDQTRPIYATGNNILFFDSSRGTDMWDLVKVAGPGGSKTIIAKDVRLPLRSRPAISPDGEWVAFAYSDPSKSNKIVLKNLSTGATKDIATDFTACGEPAIGKQGSRVLLAYTALPHSGADWRFLYIKDVTDKL